MLILPQAYQPRVYAPVPKGQWREPSQAVAKDSAGNPVVDIKFRIEARLDDGDLRWRGIFKSRDDFDAFSWSLARYLALGEPIPREEWSLPTPAWHPDVAPNARYAVTTMAFLSGSPGSLQTYTSPADWDNGSNYIWTLGAGAAGSDGVSTVTRESAGGSGGAWNEILNFVFTTPGVTTAQYQIGLGGLGQSSSNPGSFAGHNGNPGGDTWFGGSTLSASSVGSKGGGLGASRTQDGATGTQALGSAGKGTRSNNGGFSSIGGGGPEPAGGCGSGGPNGPGGNTSTANGPGSQGDGTTGGLGGAGNGSTSVAASPGSPGTEWGDGVHGSGGGGGASQFKGGDGGAYGAGGGGVATNGGQTITGGNGAQGLILLAYAPKRSPGFNMPNLGM